MCLFLRMSFCQRFLVSKSLNQLICRQFSGVSNTVGATLRRNPPWRVLFFGTDTFSLEALKIICSNYREEYTHKEKLIQTLEIVTSPTQTPVRDYAAANNLPIHCWPIAVDPVNYDVGVLASFGYLVPAKIINMFPYGILNIHPSLLPRWRGAAPLGYSILCGDEISGVTIMRIKPKHFDTGPVVGQTKFKIPHRCTTPQLSDILAPEGSKMVLDVLQDLSRISDLERLQSTDGVLYAHKFGTEFSQINWTEQTHIEIDRQYRALSHLYDLKSEYKDMKIKLKEIVDQDSYHVPEVNNRIKGYFQEESSALPPGTPFFDKKLDAVFIKCKDGWIAFKTFIIKKPISAKAFYNGYLSKEENRRLCFKSHSNPLQKDIFSDLIHRRKLN